MTLALHGFPDWQNPLATADLTSLTTNPTIGIFSNFTSAIIDMRAFNSYQLRVNAQTVAAGIAFNECRITTLWADDSAFTNIVYMDTYSIFTDGNGSGAFPSTNGRFYIHDAVHGPYIKVIVDNNSVQSISATIEILGNSRTISRRYVTNESSSGSFNVDSLSSVLLTDVAQPIGGGASIDRLLRLAPGPILCTFLAQVGAMQFNFFTPGGVNFNVYNVGGGATQYQQMIFPRTAVRLRATDASGAANNYFCLITSGRDNW